MAKRTATHRVEIPQRLWGVLDEVAARLGQPTSQLIGTWLWEELSRRARTRGDPAEGVDAGGPPYWGEIRRYPRRDYASRRRAEGGV